MKKQADTGASNSAIVKRREQLLEKARQFKGGAGEMCDVSKEIYEMGREDGIADGKAEGLIEGGLEKAKKAALNFAKMGFSVEKIAAGVEVEEDTVRQWISEGEEQTD